MVLSSYPGIEYIKIFAGKPLPFKDREFDIIYSNAVLEHVGSPDARRHFIEEALRVARKAFITVPNRWFPIDPHTGIPLLHFNKHLYRSALKPLGVALPGANSKVEGALRVATAVGATGAGLMLGPDGFFDGQIFDPDEIDGYIAAQKSAPAEA